MAKQGNRNNNNNSNGNNNSFNAANYVKKSGCSAGMGKNGNPFVRGWMRGKDGIISIIASPYSGTHISTSGSNKQWENWVVKVQPPVGGGPEYLTSGLRDVATNKVIIKDKGLVMNPNIRNGGYCGKFGS